MQKDERFELISSTEAPSDSSWWMWNSHSRNEQHCGVSLSKQYAKGYNYVWAVCIHTCPRYRSWRGIFWMRKLCITFHASTQYKAQLHVKLKQMGNNQLSQDKFATKFYLLLLLTNLKSTLVFYWHLDNHCIRLHCPFSMKDKRTQASWPYLSSLHPALWQTHISKTLYLLWRLRYADQNISKHFAKS